MQRAVLFGLVLACFAASFFGGSIFLPVSSITPVSVAVAYERDTAHFDTKNKTAEPNTGLPSERQSTSYMILLWRTLIALGLVCLMSYIFIRWGLSRWINQDDATQSTIDIVVQKKLDPHNSIVITRIGTRVFLLGTTTSTIACLAELRPEDIETKASSSATIRTLHPPPEAKMLKK